MVFGSRVCKGERPQLRDDLSKEISDLLMRCWHGNASKRPTIDDVTKFFNNTEFVCTSHEDFVNECVPCLENLNVHDNNEYFSKRITVNNVQSANVQNQIAVVSRKDLNNNGSLPKIPLKKPSESFSIINPIKTNAGGEDGNKILDTLLMLENTGQNWKELKIKLPYGSHNYGAQFLNNTIYIFGGQNAKYEPLNCTYKLLVWQWKKMTDMHQKRSWISSSNVVLNNQIWVCGGKNEKETLKSVEMYDPLTNEWKYMKPMNECRSDAAAAVVSGKIFCSGGSDNNTVECYDPSSDTWTLISYMPQNIRGHGAVDLNGKFTVIGGFSEGFLKSVWALDTTDKEAQWIKKPSISIPRRYFSIAKIYDNIFICGGNSAGKTFDLVEIFDGEVGNNGPKIPTPRSRATAVVIPMTFEKYLR